MADWISLFLLCMLMGCAVGFLAGLLGIGGGLIIVPALSYLLMQFGVIDAKLAMVSAIATSLATIIFTSSSSALAHHKNHNVPWQHVPWVFVGVGAGAVASGFIAPFIAGKTLKVVFSLAMLFIAIKMFLAKGQSGENRPMPHPIGLTMSTSGLGVLSGLLGIGGGALIVPYLSRFNIGLKQAIGAAAACGIVIALLGSVSYIITGLKHTQLSDGFLGYVYLPALLGVVLTSMWLAPFGAKATQVLPVAKIRKVFAVLLVVIALRMLLS